MARIVNTVIIERPIEAIFEFATTPASNASSNRRKALRHWKLIDRNHGGET